MQIRKFQKEKFERRPDEYRGDILNLFYVFFPKEDFNNDYVYTCIKLKEAIAKTKENDKTIDIACRFLSVSFRKHNEGVWYSDKKILDIPHNKESLLKAVENLCLSLEEYERVAFVLIEKGVSKDLAYSRAADFVCKSYFSDTVEAYDKPTMELYYPGRLNYKPYGDKINTVDGVLVDLVLNKMREILKAKYGESDDYYKKLDKFARKFADILIKSEITKEEEEFIKDFINFDVDYDTIRENYDEERKKLKGYRPLTIQEVQCLLELHNSFRNGKFSISQPYVYINPEDEEQR